MDIQSLCWYCKKLKVNIGFVHYFMNNLLPTSKFHYTISVYSEQLCYIGTVRTCVTKIWNPHGHAIKKLLN
jgi:hypothetical protein